jgi:hypothetical protein
MRLAMLAQGGWQDALPALIGRPMKYINEGCLRILRINTSAEQSMPGCRGLMTGYTVIPLALDEEGVDAGWVWQ